jgi:hypothetical protein
VNQKALAILTVVLVALVTFAGIYFGDSAITVTPVEGDLPDVSITPEASDFLLAAGIAPVIVAVVEVAKLMGWLPDGTAGKVQAIGQALAYLVVLFANGFFGLDVMNPTTQQILAIALTVLQFAISVLGALGLFKAGRAAGVLKPLPGRS